MLRTQSDILLQERNIPEAVKPRYPLIELLQATMEKTAEDPKPHTESFMRALIGGIDPTGLTTFDVGMKEEDRSRDLLHNFLGILGGGIGGAALIPAATGAMFGIGSNLKRLRGIQGMAPKAKMLASSAWEGATLPFTAMKAYWDAGKRIDQSIASKKITGDDIEYIMERLGVPGITAKSLTPQEMANILHGVAKRDPEGMSGLYHDLYRRARKSGLDAAEKHQPGFTKAFKDVEGQVLKEDPNFIRNLGRQSQKDFLHGLRRMPNDEFVMSLEGIQGEGARQALGSVSEQSRDKVLQIAAGMGMSGLIGGAGSYGQYGSGAKAGERIRELERALSKKKQEELGVDPSRPTALQMITQK